MFIYSYFSFLLNLRIFVFEEKQKKVSFSCVCGQFISWYKLLKILKWMHCPNFKSLLGFVRWIKSTNVNLPVKKNSFQYRFYVLRCEWVNFNREKWFEMEILEIMDVLNMRIIYSIFGVRSVWGVNISVFFVYIQADFKASLFSSNYLEILVCRIPYCNYERGKESG